MWGLVLIMLVMPCPTRGTVYKASIFWLGLVLIACPAVLPSVGAFLR